MAEDEDAFEFEFRVKFSASAGLQRRSQLLESDHYSRDTVLHPYLKISTMASIRTPTIALRSGGICRQCARSLARRPLLQQGARAHLSQHPWRFKAPYSLQHDEIKTDYKLPQLETKVYGFDQVKKLSESPSSDQILIGNSHDLVSKLAFL